MLSLIRLLKCLLENRMSSSYINKNVYTYIIYLVFIIHYDLPNGRYQILKVKAFCIYDINNVRPDSKEFNLKWLLLLNAGHLSPVTWLRVIKRISNSMVQRLKVSRQRLPMPSQHSPSYRN